MFFAFKQESQGTRLAWSSSLTRAPDRLPTRSSSSVKVLRTIPVVLTSKPAVSWLVCTVTKVVLLQLLVSSRFVNLFFFFSVKCLVRHEPQRQRGELSFNFFVYKQVLNHLKPEGLKVYGTMSMVRNSVGANCYVADEIIKSRAGVRVSWFLYNNFVASVDLQSGQLSLVKTSLQKRLCLRTLSVNNTYGPWISMITGAITL